ncbi:hypothetical protein PAF15_00955 [Weissella koreensis]|uniref:hypothetical protein n=1 Tax=Weissella koreensis TaxID=165096 RepID=UPI0022BA1146|nr:hypothetical protein [Weissella koreensis]MCZ9310546.1 hypothetical protein [Weissella koreensis]
MDLDKILSIFKKKSFLITLLCVLLSIVMLIVSDKASKQNTEHKHDQKTYLYISNKLLSYDASNDEYYYTDKNGLFKFKPKTHKNTHLTIYNGEVKNKEIIFESKKYDNSEITLDLSKTKDFEQSGGFHIIVVAKQKGLPKNVKSFDLSNKSSLYESYVSSLNSIEDEKVKKEYSESVESAKASSSSSEQSSTEISTSSDSSTDMNSTIKDLVGTSSDFKKVKVNGSYVADPYNAVITVTSDKDVRVVMAAILGNMQKNAGDKLNNFDSISISIKDSNGNYALKTYYNVSTIMNNSKVYEPFKVKSLANSWSEN